MTDGTTGAAPLPGLFDLIAWVETKSNCRAVRFEPATYAAIAAARSDSQKLLIAKIQSACACSWGTALMIYSSSWGAVQLMGFNLYADQIGYEKSIIDFCDDQGAQRTTFARFLAWKKLDTFSVDMLSASLTNRQAFGKTYNGDGAAYADAIAAALHHFNLPVSA